MAEPIQDADWDVDLGGPKELPIRWGPDPLRQRGNFEGKKSPAQDMPGHVQRSVYSKRLSRGQYRYGVDASWGVPDWGAYWRHLANTVKPSMCSGIAALC